MLEERRRSSVLGIVALKSARVRGCYGSDEVRVFTIALLDAPPPRIARQVGIGRADDDPSAFARMKALARFGFFDLGYFLHELGIPRFAEADGLRKCGGGERLIASPAGRSAEREPMQAFDLAGETQA